MSATPESQPSESSVQDVSRPSEIIDFLTIAEYVVLALRASPDSYIKNGCLDAERD